MPGLNKILPFATEEGANVLSDAEWDALTAQGVGFTAGVAPSIQLNKAWRQSSVMAAALAQFIADNQVEDITDAVPVATLAEYLQEALAAGIIGVTAGKAQQVDQAVTATTRATTTDLTGESLEGTLSDTSADITAFHGVAGLTYRRKCLGAGKIVAGAGLTILQGGTDIPTELNGTVEVYMLTSTTSEVRNYVRAVGPDAAQAVAGRLSGRQDTAEDAGAKSKATLARLTLLTR